MAIVCEEIFDESSHPSLEEIRDYATKIGIDPDSEPQLLPLAAEGLMKALPPGWKPCYDDNSKSYYYYNNLTGKTQWEHPLDDVYRGLVKKVRAESQSISLNEQTEDATYARDLESYEEPPLQAIENKVPKARKLSPLKFLSKQKSEDLEKTKLTFNIFSSFDEKNNFDRHPRTLTDKGAGGDLKVSGGGTMFLKMNTKKQELSPSKTYADSLKSILRERNSLENNVVEVDKISQENDDDRKSVRFNLENTATDVAITFSEKSSTDDEQENDLKKQALVNDPIKPSTSRFTVTPVQESNLKLIKPNPGDFIKPILTVSRESDSEESSPSEDLRGKTKKFEEKTQKKLAQLKQDIWEEKNDELVKFRANLQGSHKEELERILIKEKTSQEEKIKDELENLRIEMENRNSGTLKEERLKHDKILKEELDKLEEESKKGEDKLKTKFEEKKEELERYYEEKLVEIEKELAERMEQKRDDLILNHNSNIEQLKQNHSIILQELKKGFKVEEDQLRKQHKDLMFDIKNSKKEQEDKVQEKLKCEKKLLEDKYRCLKEKYLRLKTDVKLSIEKKHKRKEQSTTTTTGSETERSYSNNKDKTPLNSPLKKPPSVPSKILKKPEPKTKLIIQDLDTSISDRSEIDKNRNHDNDSSDNNSSNPGRSRKKLFSRLKSSSTSRINNNNNNVKSRRNQQRSCSPVENLRRQLQKLEDLEDQFPQTPQGDTYHLRYPFSDGQKFEGCSELEFFRHRIHLERDSIKRAKESLRCQKSLFQQRQKELKLKHGPMARHTLQQLCQEEKELTDMEVNLHRTRSLLGEKVIRLRHLEASLQRATLTQANSDQNYKQEDTTLSDLSSHSASSGISSTEFATAPDVNLIATRHLIHSEHLQESSEIIQSLENLNSEIREIWDVLHKQQSSTTVIPPLVYHDLGWPLLAGIPGAALPAPPSIPTLADRLHNYRQHVALANAQSTVVTQNQGAATTTLVERTRNLRHWLRQTPGVDPNPESGNSPQATL